MSGVDGDPRKFPGFNVNASCIRSLQKTVRFWLDHSVDKERGGYYNCLARDGELFDSSKYTELQGQQLYTFCKLYEVADGSCLPKHELLKACKSGAAFIKNSCISTGKRKIEVYYSVTESGAPQSLQHETIEPHVYTILGFLAFAKISHDHSYIEIAEQLFDQIKGEINRKSVFGSHTFALAKAKNYVCIRCPVLFLQIIREFMKVAPDMKEKFTPMAVQCLDSIYKNLDPETGCLRENGLRVGRTQKKDDGSHFGRKIDCLTVFETVHTVHGFAQENPELAEKVGMSEGFGEEVPKLMDYMHEHAWDAERGGYYNIVDACKRCRIEPEWNSKSAAVNLQGLAACALSVTLDHRTGYDLNQAWDYLENKMEDKEFGGFFMCMSPDNSICLDIKGGSGGRQGCFYGPGALQAAHACLQDYIDDNFPGFDFTLCAADVQDCEDIAEEIKDALAKSLDIPPENIVMTLLPNGKNTTAKFNMKPDNNLQEKLEDPLLDGAMRDNLMADPKIAATIPDQSLTEHGAAFTGVPLTAIEDKLPLLNNELAEILGMPPSYINAIDSLDTHPIPLVMFQHPVAAKLDHAALQELVDSLKDHDECPELADIGLAEKIPYEFIFPVAGMDQLEPLQQELIDACAKATVAPEIYREADALPELANDYYKVPPPINSIDLDPMHAATDGTLVPYIVEVPVITEPMLQGMKDHSFDDIIMREMMKQPGLLNLMKQMDIVEQHNIPICRASPPEVLPVLFNVESNFANAIDVPNTKVAAIMEEEDMNTWVTFTMIKEDDIADKLFADGLDDQFRQNLAYDYECRDIPDQRLKDRALCFSNVEENVAHAHLDEIEDILATTLHIPHEACPVFDKVVEFPEGPVCVFGTPACVPITHQDEIAFIDRLRNSDGMENCDLSPAVTYDFPFTSAFPARKLKRYKQELEEGMAGACVSPDLKDRVMPPEWREKEYAAMVPYYTGPLPANSVKQKSLIPAKNGDIKVHYQLDTGALDGPICKAIVEDRFDDVVFKEIMKRLPGMMKDAGLAADHEFCIAKTPPEVCDNVLSQLEKDMAKVLGVPSEKVACILDDCARDNTMCNFFVKNDPELVENLNAKDTDGQFRNAICDDDDVCAEVPDQSLVDEVICLTGVPHKLVEDTLQEMKDDLCEIMGIPDMCIPEINAAERDEGSLVSFNHPAAAKFTPAMLDDFMEMLKNKPGFGNVGLCDKVTHAYLFPKVPKHQLKEPDLQASCACVPVRVDMAKPDNRGVLKDGIHEFNDYYYCDDPPLETIEVVETSKKRNGTEILYEIDVGCITNEMVKDMHDEKFDDVIFNETMKMDKLYRAMKDNKVCFDHPFPLIQTDMHDAKRAQQALEMTAAESLGMCAFDLAIVDFEPLDGNVICHFAARNTPENTEKLLDPESVRKIRGAIDKNPALVGVIPPQSMDEKAICIDGVTAPELLENKEIVEEILNEAMGTPPDTCKMLDVTETPDGALMVFEHPHSIPATDEKMQDFIDRLKKHPKFRNAQLVKEITYLFEFRFGKPDDLEPVSKNLIRAMGNVAEIDPRGVDIHDLTEAADDCASIMYGIDTNYVDLQLARKQENNGMDEPLLQTLFRDLPFAQHLIDRGCVIYQNVPLVNASNKDVEKLKDALIAEICDKMQIGTEDIVLINEQNGKCVDLKFYIKGTDANREFVNSGALRKAVFDFLDSDPNNGIPEQNPEDTAVCLGNVTMAKADKAGEQIQDALGKSVDLPPECMPIYDIIHVPEGPLVIFEHPKSIPFNDKAQEVFIDDLLPVRGFKDMELAPIITHMFQWPVCGPDKLKGLEPRFVEALSKTIDTPEENIQLKKMKDKDGGTEVEFKIDTPAINRKFADLVRDGTLNQKLGDELYNHPDFLDLLEEMGILTGVEIGLVDCDDQQAEEAAEPLKDDMCELIEVPEKDTHMVFKDDPNGPNKIAKFYIPKNADVEKRRDEDDLDGQYRDVIQKNDHIVGDVLGDQSLVDTIVCLNSTSAKEVEQYQDIVKHEFAKAHKSPDCTCKFLDNTDIPGGALTVMTYPKVRKVTDDTLNVYILGLRKHPEFANVQLTAKVCVAFYFPQVTPEELEPLKGELIDCLSHILEMTPDAIDIAKLTQKEEDDHTQVIYLIDADYLTPKNARILMRSDFNELLLEELQKYPGINALLTRKGIIGRYLTCDISLENVTQDDLKPYEKDLVECFIRAMGPDSADENVMIVAFGEDEGATAVSFQIRETDTALDALDADDFETKYMAELAKIPGLAELLGLTQTFMTANIALTDVDASEIAPYKDDIEGCLQRALFTEPDNVEVTDISQDGENTILGFQVGEDEGTSKALHDDEFNTRLFEEFAQIEGLNYLLGLKSKEVFDVKSYGEGGVPKMGTILSDDEVFYGLVNMRIRNGRRTRHVPIFLQFLGEAAPDSRHDQMEDLIEEAQTVFGDVEGGLNVTSVDQVSSEQIMEALPEVFRDGDIDLDDTNRRKRGPETKMIVGPDGVKRFVSVDGDDEEERVQEILGLLHSNMGWVNWVVFKTNSNRLELASEDSFGSGSIYAMANSFSQNDVLWGLIRLSFGVRPYRRSHWVMIHWIGPRVPNVKRGRQNAQYNKMDRLLRPFGVALQFTRMEDWNVHNVIDRVRDIVVTDGMDDEGPEDDNDVNELLIKQWKAALEEEERANQNVTKKLKADREEDGELTLAEIVEYVRTPDEDINWLLISPKK